MRFNTVATAVAVTLLTYEITHAEFMEIAKTSNTKDLINFVYAQTGYDMKRKVVGIETERYAPSLAFALQVRKAFIDNNKDGRATYSTVMKQLTE